MVEHRGDDIAVLHVEDDPEVAELAATFLERESDRISVRSVSRGAEALDLLEDVDCVVSDYQMPGMDGLTLLEEVRARDEDLPFILYTGEGSEAVASDAISGGATDYLQKESGTEQYELLANRIEHAVDSLRTESRAARLEHVREVQREVNRALVRETGRGAIARRVCEILVETGDYRAAWTATVDPETGWFEPTEAAGIDRDALVVETDAPAPTLDPVVAALRTGQVRVIDDLATVEADPVRERATDHDLRSTALAPLEYDEAHHGVLAVHDERPGTMDATDRELLQELAGDVAHAIDAARTREELRDERDRRSALFENAPSPVAQFRLVDGRPILDDVNDAFEEVFGYDAETVVGEPADEYLIPEEGMEGHRDIVSRVSEDDVVEREVRRRTADGVRDFHLATAPFEVAGVTGGYVWYIDITERKQLAAELQDKANLLDQLFKQLPVSVYVKDTEGRHLHMSDYDVDPEGVIGKTDIEIYGDEEFARETYRDDMQVIETGEPIINKEEYNPDNGEWTLTSKVPWYGDDGDIKGLIGVTRFITEKKEYEREIERKNERLEKFASVVSHDLRNPLNVAAGRLDLLKQDLDDERLDQIETALDRMDALIDDILELAKQGRTAYEPEPVSLAALADGAWANVETGQATLSVADDATIEADEARALELFENLFRNAVEHAMGDSNLTVEVGPLADGFYVADDGEGIPADEREDVFEPGYTTEEAGTGFGLAIVAEIIDGHGWDVDVTESESGGARFEVRGVETQ